MNKELTPSQQAAHEKLNFFFKLGLSGIDSVEGISPRPIALVVGQSGCGKTHLVRGLAEEHKLPIFSINITNWIVRGSRNEAQGTMEQLREFISTSDAGVIFIDEINKLMSSHVEQSSWMADVFTEFIALMDQDSRLEPMGLSGLVEKLRRKFIIVGAAAFQDEWNASQKSAVSIGFTGNDQIQEGQERAFEQAISSQGTIPEELLFRFNDRLIVILPPTKQEYTKRIVSIRQALALPPLDHDDLAKLSESAHQSGKSMRWLEGYLTECLSQVSDKVLESLAPIPFGEFIPTVSPKGNDVIDRKQYTALRDGCYERFENCLRALSGSSRSLHLLIQGVMLGYRTGVNDPAREQICQGILKMGSKIAPEQSDEGQLLILGRSLDYLAEQTLGLTSALGTSVDRGKRAVEVTNLASKITDEMPYLLARCAEGSEDKLIREHAIHFAVAAKGVSHHLQELKKMDTEKGMR